MNDTNKLSRRGLLGGVAVSSVALVGCGEDAPLGPDPDVTTLNGLLSAEYAAIKAYEAGGEVIAMAPMTDPFVAYKFALQAIASRWKMQHEEHAAQLVNTIRALRGVPVLRPTGQFMAPTGFTPSIRNVMVLACNAERGAAVAYCDAVSALKQSGSRFLAGSIEGDETQHFIVLYGLLRGALSAGSEIATGGVNFVVPRSFVSTINGTALGLQAEMDFTFT